MKRIFLLLTSAFLLLSYSSKSQATYMKIFLDTKKFTFTPCNLNADGSGGPSPVTKVYMHAGLCSHDPANPSDANANKIFCLSQIIPLHSLVWQHVVGNWGTSPADDGVGQMNNDGSGIWSLEMNTMENYFSSPDVSTAVEPVSNVTSSPLPPGYKGYVMGIVFRNFDGSIIGRDSSCHDIFIIDMDTPDPKVVQSDPLGEWITSPVSFFKAPAGIENKNPEIIINTYPNPSSSAVRIEYMLLADEENLDIKITDILGNTVANLFSGKNESGKNMVIWDGTNLNGETAATGIYLCVIKGKNDVSARRLNHIK